MPAHPTIGIDNDLAPGESGILLRTSDHEPPGRVDEVLRMLVHRPPGNERPDDIFKDIAPNSGQIKDIPYGLKNGGLARAPSADQTVNSFLA